MKLINIIGFLWSLFTYWFYFQWTSTFEWYVVKRGSHNKKTPNKRGPQEVGIHAQFWVTWTFLSSTINHVWLFHETKNIQLYVKEDIRVSFTNYEENGDVDILEIISHQFMCFSTYEKWVWS